MEDKDGLVGWKNNKMIRMDLYRGIASKNE